MLCALQKILHKMRDRAYAARNSTTSPSGTNSAAVQATAPVIASTSSTDDDEEIMILRGTTRYTDHRSASSALPKSVSVSHPLFAS